MAKYNGKNKINSSIELAFERSKFRSEKMTGEEKVMKDFTIFENHHYGRIDPQMNVVYLNEVNLKNFNPQSNSSISAVNFVVDAFKKVQSRFKMAAAVGQIPRDLPFLSEPEPHTGYKDTKELYSSYIKEVLEIK